MKDLVKVKNFFKKYGNNLPEEINKVGLKILKEVANDICKKEDTK